MRANGHNGDPPLTEPRQRPTGRCAAEVAVQTSKSSLGALILGAIGVVYGDIGTSVLYCVKEVFGSGHVPFTSDNVYGILSIFFWTLTVIVSLKYVVLVLRADNDGEGGLVAMLALASQTVKDKPRLRKCAAAGGHFRHLACSTAMASSRRPSRCSSRSRAWRSSRRTFKKYVMPITLVVLFCLFLVQKRGSASIGRFFGPVTLLWFIAIAALGLFAHRRHTRASCGPSARTTRCASSASTPASASSSWAPWCCA